MQEVMMGTCESSVASGTSKPGKTSVSGESGVAGIACGSSKASGTCNTARKI